MRQLFREPAALTVLAVAINQSLGHNLPTERTVLFIRDPRAGVKKLPTWQAKEPTPRANGNWVRRDQQQQQRPGVDPPAQSESVEDPPVSA